MIAYQIRQSFKPGEITPEEANRAGYELAERFTKGKQAFIVATHTDRAHIHNHIIFNSTTLDCSHKFKDFYYCGLTIQRLSDLVTYPSKPGLRVFQYTEYNSKANAAPPATQESEESAIEDIGKVEVEQKLLSVEITVPADFVGETTQADLDANVSAGKFLSAKLNDDGSVTYKMTKGQHKEVMEGIKESIVEALDEMIASEDYSFTKIEPNSDFTKFKVTTTSSELNLAKSFSVLAFYMYGGMYNVFNGTEVENIAVDFINEATGQIMNSANSRDMGE